MTNTVAALGSETRVAQLVELAIRGLEAMYDEEQGLFCHRLKQTPSGNIKEGISQRYTVMTLIGAVACRSLPDIGLPSTFAPLSMPYTEIRNGSITSGISAFYFGSLQCLLGSWTVSMRHSI